VDDDIGTLGIERHDLEVPPDTSLCAQSTRVPGCANDRRETAECPAELDGALARRHARRDRPLARRLRAARSGDRRHERPPGPWAPSPPSFARRIERTQRQPRIFARLAAHVRRQHDPRAGASGYRRLPRSAARI
jgi:hypothetical protein